MVRLFYGLWVILLGFCFISGCGSSAEVDRNEVAVSKTVSEPAAEKSVRPSRKLEPKQSTREIQKQASAKKVAKKAVEQKADRKQAVRKPASGPAAARTVAAASSKINSEVLQRAGVRRLAGKHLTLYTDLPSSAAVDELPGVFDQAFPQWCEYFGLNAAEHEDWHVNGFLIKDKGLFERLKLMPEGGPPFRHGYSQGDRLWLYEQESDYYRRHLLLHEGTHSFMDMLLGDCGPPWYMEGMAELLGTHSWKDGKLELNYFPAAKVEAPRWNRPKIVADAVAAGRERSLEEILGYGPTAHLDNEPYGWCWTAAVMLDRHPRYRDRFRQLYKNVTRGDFTERFRRLMGDDWADMTAQWQAFSAGLEFGHDVGRTTVRLQPAEALPPGGKTVQVEADRGWQNSGVELEAGRTYKLTASGRYQVADRPKVWWCEPGGVTVRYYRGRPRGVLLGVVYPKRADGGKNPFREPISVGLGTSINPRESGVLFFKINDSSAELGDNAGNLEVRVETAGSGAVDGDGLTN